MPTMCNQTGRRAPAKSSADSEVRVFLEGRLGLPSVTMRSTDSAGYVDSMASNHDLEGDASRICVVVSARRCRNARPYGAWAGSPIPTGKRLKIGPIHRSTDGRVTICLATGASWL